MSSLKLKVHYKSKNILRSFGLDLTVYCNIENPITKIQLTVCADNDNIVVE